jgi:hypothetical protein
MPLPADSCSSFNAAAFKSGMLGVSEVLEIGAAILCGEFRK